MPRNACAWYCAVLLLISGYQHQANQYLFFSTILDYQILSPFWSMALSAALPWLHLFLSAILIAPVSCSRTPFWAVVALATLFILAQVTVMVRGIPVDCGCFGAFAQRPVGMASLALAASLWGVALLGAIIIPRPDAWSVAPCTTPLQQTKAQ